MIVDLTKQNNYIVSIDPGTVNLGVAVYSEESRKIVQLRRVLLGNCTKDIAYNCTLLINSLQLNDCNNLIVLIEKQPKHLGGPFTYQANLNQSVETAIMTAFYAIFPHVDIEHVQKQRQRKIQKNKYSHYKNKQHAISLVENIYKDILSVDAVNVWLKEPKKDDLADCILMILNKVSIDQL